MRSSSIKHFLVIRDSETGVTEVRQFARPGVAYDAYFSAEAQHTRRGVPDARFTIVLIQAESEQALREAYPQYFRTGTRQQRERELKMELHRKGLAFATV